MRKNTVFATGRNLALILAAVLPHTANADVIFTDTFDSGTGSWYRATTQGTLTTSSDDWLSWSRGVNTANEVIGRSFPTTEVGVGESIRLTFDYRQTSSSVSILRAGLFDVGTSIAAGNWAGGNAIGAWEGYYTFVRDNSTAGNVARTESGASTNATNSFPTYGGTSIGSNNTQYDINQDGTTTYQGLFEVFRVSTTQMDTLFTLSSNSSTHFSVAGTTSTVQDSFNTVVLRSAGGTSLFDNIQVTFIPEPGMWLLLLSALAWGLLVRRRK
jgi:hypothetical protein